jgi:hypothetical protein
VTQRRAYGLPYENYRHPDLLRSLRRTAANRIDVVTRLSIRTTVLCRLFLLDEALPSTTSLWCSPVRWATAHSGLWALKQCGSSAVVQARTRISKLETEDA